MQPSNHLHDNFVSPVVRSLLSTWLSHEVDAGRCAPIEQMVSEYPELVRPRLFAELVLEEISLLRSKADTAISLEDYIQRFPERKEELVILWEKVSVTSNAKQIFPGSENTITSDQTVELSVGEIPEAVLYPSFRGTETDRYQLLREIGGGGMGVVYEALDRKLGRKLAIKVVTEPRHLQRQSRELALLAKLNSNYVVKIYDFIFQNDESFGICMELVPGGTLEKEIKKDNDSINQEIVEEWMRQTCMGMIAVADNGITHRDLKPSNILLDENNSIKVCDFGLARTDESLEKLTHGGEILGTFLYMAPEQGEDPRSASGRSDIYSFGATFYHILTGQPPFSGANPFALLFKHKTEPLRSPRALNPQLSERVCDILERCLAKAPEDRFQNFNQILCHLSHSKIESLSPWEMIGSVELGDMYSKFKQRLPGYVAEHPVTDARNDSFSFSNGHSIHILSGDISECETDAIVSSDDEYLSMGGGVSWAIRRRAGQALENQAKTFGKIRPGRSVVTTGGDLKAKYVIHGVTLGVDTLPSRDLIADIVRSVFYHADTLNLSTISFPLLGTGIGGFSKEICLETMFRTIARIMLHGMTSVRESRIILFDPFLKNQPWYRV